MLSKLPISLLSNLSLISMNVLVMANGYEHFIFFLSLKIRKILAEAIPEISNNKISGFWSEVIFSSIYFFSLWMSFTTTELCTMPIWFVYKISKSTSRIKGDPSLWEVCNAPHNRTCWSTGGQGCEYHNGKYKAVNNIKW